MAYRGRGHDSDSSDREEDDLPLNVKESSEANEEEDEGPSAKRAATLWGDALLEQNLLQKGSRISLEKKSNDSRIARGVETYHVPTNFVRLDKEELESYSKTAEQEAKAENATDDPFGDAPIDLSVETAFCERISSRDNWYSRGREVVRGALGKRGHSSNHATSSRGRGPPGRIRGGGRGSFVDRGRGNGLKRPWPGKVVDPGELLSASYSLETLMAAEFASDITLEQLGDEIGKAMGERDPKTVKNIVNVCGMEKALALFEETRKVESTGGMMTENGQRRRTPGGVFISLFKLDSEIPEDVKKRLFGETKHEARKMGRARRRGHSSFQNDVAKLAELMRREKEKEAGEPLKPLPHVEEQFRSRSSEAPMDNDELTLDDIAEAEMES